MNYSIFDIETDGLVSTKIHCLCAREFKNGVIKDHTITDYNEMRKFLAEQNILVGHYITIFDIPELERILGIKINARIIDTLGVSWYLYPTRDSHGLEDWGIELGIAKPEIKDWQNLTVEEYVHRCQEDVKINTKLFHKQVHYLKAIYREEGIDRILNYISFKMDCAREQEQVRWKLDEEKCRTVLEKLERDKLAKIEALKAVMPKKTLYRIAKKPKMYIKQDGTLSAKGEVWQNLLEELSLPPEYEGEIKIVKGEEEPKPTSHTQVKAWLDSLGWIPRTFKFVKDDLHNITKQIPQINTGEGVCESVKDLYEREPALENLDGLYVIAHRIGILKGFLRDKSEDGYLKARIAGFTNTMRFMHTELVNLPTVNKPYGEDIRGCLTVPGEEWELCGSDMSSLEDNTKQHYIFFFDPEYVKQMRVPGFDPHLDIAIQGGMLTEMQVAAHKAGTENHGKVRKDAKQVNFSAVYGVGPPKLARTTGWPISKAKMMLQAYWKRNWAVKKVAEACTVITVNNQMWLWNPVSRFFYSLRFDKDRFSTLNQSTGVYCFDNFVMQTRRRNIKICGQFHDEIAFPLLKVHREEVKQKLKDSIKAVNDKLKLNVELGISMDFGKNYAETH